MVVRATIAENLAGTLIEFASNSSFDATLNGGGFDMLPEGVIGTQVFKTSTSMHDMDLGAILGAAAALLRENLDTAVRTPQDLEDLD